MTTDHDARDRTDRRARTLHAEAVRHVPGPTLLQLQARRAAAGRATTRTPRALGWGAGAAFAALVAIAVGLRPGALEPDPAPGPVAMAEPAPAPGTPEAPDALQDAFAALDEDPDLYLWLASADAQPLAME